VREDETGDARRGAPIVIVIGLPLLVGLPLGGMMAAGKFSSELLEFPPLTRYVEHAPFSWIAFIALAVFILVATLPFLVHVATHQPGERSPAERRAFPWWGWTGLALVLAAWFLAWTRFSWFQPFQVFAFSPIWCGYILLVNAISFRRTGHCMVKDRPRHLFELFLASAVFWWYFEYLNRFVQNWFYVGGEHLSPLEYFFFATLPFSTVLPAVMSTYELLGSCPRLSAGLDGFVVLKTRNPRMAAWAFLGLSIGGLAAIGVWPDMLFPLLWISPLVILTSLQRLAGRRTIFAPIAEGRWRRIYLLALAALICGFFWEMWNYRSLAKWIYTVPYVGRFRIFEMPLLGFAGYLPFGLECAVVAESWFRSLFELRRTLRAVTATAFLLLGVWRLPYWWCSRDADRWLDGDVELYEKLGNGVRDRLERDLLRDSFSTGSRQFDGEWLFGTYLMAGIGYSQSAIEHPRLLEENRSLAEECIERILSPEVRAFDREMWDDDPIDTLEGDSDHAAYLGYFNILLGLHRTVDSESRFAPLHDRITAALAHRLESTHRRRISNMPLTGATTDQATTATNQATASR